MFRITLILLVLVPGAFAAPLQVQAERISAPIPSNYEIFGTRLRWESGRLAGLVTAQGDCHWENGDPLPHWVCRDASANFRFPPVFELRGSEVHCTLAGIRRRIGTTTSFLGFKRVRLDSDVAALPTHSTLHLTIGLPPRQQRFQALHALPAP